MKKLLKKKITGVFLFTMILALQGCLKDTCRNTYKIYRPVYKSLTEVRAGMKSESPQSMKNTGKLNLFGPYIFLNERGKGIHVINNSNPSSPKNVGFINIPGNIDVAVKGPYLYADSYSDIIVFDISDPLQVAPVKFMDNAMKEKNVYWTTATRNYDSIKVVTGYSEKDTLVDCNTYRAWGRCNGCSLSASATTTQFYAAAPQIGTGGSMASFTIVADYLYAVSSQSLYCINITDGANPQQASVKTLGWGIESVYPFQNKLFIGSSTGMFIYDISNGANPTAQGRFSHATRCDPVIADGPYAYVTLRGGTTCNGFTNELNVIDVSNLAAPVLKKTYKLDNPYGLSKDGATLFICDGKEGLKIYNSSDPLNLQLTKHINGPETYDVIARSGKAIVVAKDGLYQYDYSDLANIRQMSKLTISN